MQCVYCDVDCTPTGEHVIPKWYGEATGDDGLEAFNAKRPTTHRRGPMKIRDVCDTCNNERLGSLDDYGKLLYESYFKTPVFYGESITIQVDKEKLIRWLLKLCFNSARVHNADVTILRKYRRYILGLDTSPKPTVYVHVVAPTDFRENVWAPALRIFGDTVRRPRWFRLTQYRATPPILTEIVQRQIYIDSFCFTIFAVDPDTPRHAEQLKTLESQFKKLFVFAKAIPEDGELVLTARDVHAAQAILPHADNYPTRYFDGPPSVSPDFAELIKELITGQKKLLWLIITKEEIDAGDITGIVARLKELVATRESAMAAMQKIMLSTDGYDADERELWQIPEARDFFRRVFLTCPFIAFLLFPPSNSLQPFLFCCCDIVHRPDGGNEFKPDQIERFIKVAFDGLNKVTQKYAISTEFKNEITDEILRSILSLTVRHGR